MDETTNRATAAPATETATEAEAAPMAATASEAEAATGAVTAPKAAGTAKQTVHFPSSDGTSTISGYLWMPDLADGAQPRALVQLVHGMSEHAGRYDDFARFLTGAGFAVCANDHIGHGGSASGDGYGYLPPDTGVQVMLKDVDAMRRTARERVGADVPYFIFGHSMGSLVVRAYIAYFGAGVAGAVVCGTADKPAIVPLFGQGLISAAALFRGWHAKATFFNNLANRTYTKEFRHENSPLAWISRNAENVRAYIADEITGFTITLGASYTLMKLGRIAMSHGTARRVPRDLPVLFIAGAQDPVGDNGRDVERAERRLHRAGVENVGLILYGEMRHEILNETGHALVYADVAAWIEEVLVESAARVAGAAGATAATDPGNPAALSEANGREA